MPSLSYTENITYFPTSPVYGEALVTLNVINPKLLTFHVPYICKIQGNGTNTNECVGIRRH